MPSLVRANDVYTFVEFGIETTYGVAPTYDNANYERFPFMGETLKIEKETLPLSEEFSTFGGLTGVDIGKVRVRGSISFEPQYNTQWMWKLFGLGFAHENVLQNYTILGDAVTEPSESVNVHIFNMGNAKKSLTMNVWKAGPETPSGTNWIDIWKGLYITQWKWEQPEGNRCKITLDFVGKSVTTVAASGLTSGPTEVVGFKVNMQHLGTGTNNGVVALKKLGSLSETKLTGFTITCNRKIDDTSPGFINDVTTANEPGIEGTREVTVDFTTNLETDYNATNYIWPSYVAGDAVAMHVLYDCGTTISTNPASTRGLRLDIPKIVLTDVQNSISKAGTQTMSGTGTAVVAAWTGLGSYNHTALNVDTADAGDVRACVVVLVSEEDTPDAKFTGLASAP